MESASQVNVPLRSGGKKMRKRRELDALVAHSLAKRANKKNNAGNGVNSQDQLLSPSTDEQEEFGWPKVVRNSNRSRNQKFSFIRMCAPLIFVSCISLSLGFMYWLYFDLRQQLYEYRQKIEEVSVTSQNLPEALQKWHETSKNLEQNQTVIYGKISDLRHRLGNLSVDFSHYKDKLKEKDYSKDEKFVAEFGAKIEAASLDIESMKEHFSEIQRKQGELKESVVSLQDNFIQVLNKSSSNANNETENYSEQINNLKTSTFEQMKSLASNLSIINDTLSQRTELLGKESLRHQKNLDVLSEANANTTSHVISIEKGWPKYKDKVNELDKTRIGINQEISEVRNTTLNLIQSIQDTQSKCNQYHMEMIKFLEQIKNNENNSSGAIIQNEEPLISNIKPSSAVPNNSTPKIESKPTQSSTAMPSEGKPKFLSLPDTKPK